MTDITKDAAQRVAAAMMGLPEEAQESVGKFLANSINVAMDLAEQIAPILAKAMQTDPAA